MAKSLNVLFISSEVEPFAKTGGLADVSGALPQTIRHLGHEIRIMMPRYGSIDERKGGLHPVARLNEIEVPVGTKTYTASVKSSFIPGGADKVQVYFLDNEQLFGRQGLYVHPETNADFPDNDARFIFFCRGILEVLKHLGWAPDIIHCNDWPTGLVPAYLRSLYRDDPFYRRTRTVFTIHNMAYQGVFPKASFAKTLLPATMFSDDGVAANGSLNFLKAGLVYGDAITTVSEKYAQEISSSAEYGCGLEEVAKRRRKDLVGILNGIDYTLWDPSVDELLPRHYDAKSLEGKLEDKKALLAHVGLPFNEETPVIGIISRLADQKGFDLIGEIIDRIPGVNAQLVVLGTGDRKYHKLFEDAARRHPRHIAVRLAFDNPLAHLIEAGSDMFLMPSRYEPCGLNQLYSLRYGTVPVVRATGGLDDTIENYNASAGTGTGFKFLRYDAGELLETIQRAVLAFRNQAGWRRLMKNGMAKDFSWETSAKKYIRLYRSLAQK